MSDLWGWLILILVLLLILAIIWWWWKERNAPAASGTEHGYRATPPDVEPPAVPAAAVEHVSVPAPEPPKVVPPATVDDLTIVEGIGPKIDSLLKANGIASFAALAAADVETLRTILRAAGLSYADPATWGEQARLAAAGKMDELQALQDSLKGGRRA
jgi:predicted flap endonuclease-1-like 5' DNA nuclease